MSNVLVQENVFEVEVTCGETVVVTMPGATGERGTIDIGTTSAVNPDQPAAVENVGTLNDAILNFAIPRGSHVSVGTTSPTTYSTDNPAISDSGTNGDVVLDFTLPRAPTISVGTTSNVDYGTPAEVVNSGTNGDVVLDFTLQSGPLAKVTELRWRTTLGGATGTVAINITDFNASFDLLHVYINSTYIAQGSDYTISGTNIVKISGTWATGTIIDFVCFRSILIPAETLPEAIGDLPIPDLGNFYPIDTIDGALQSIGSLLASKTKNPNTIVLIGDSITSSNSNFGSGGFFTWTNFLLKQRMDVLYNGGVNGDTTTSIIARLNTDVIAYNPTWCHLLMGTNNLKYTSDTAQDMIDDFIYALQTLTAAGIRVIIGTIPPGNYDASHLAIMNTVNNWIRNNAPSYGIVVDYNLILTDAATGTWKSGTSTDLTHPNVLGALKMGQLLFDELKYIVPFKNILVSSNADSYVINSNPMMLGNAGGIATGYALSGATATPSKVARTDGFGEEWQRLVLSDDTAFIRYMVSDNDANNANKTFYGLIEFKTSSIASVLQIGVDLAVYNSAGNTLYTTISSLLPDIHTVSFGTDELDGIMLVGPVTSPELGTQIRFTLKMYAAMTIDIGRIEIFEA